MLGKIRQFTAVTLLAVAPVLPVAAQNQFENVTIETISLNGPVHMLIGQGGNIGVSAGEDGTLMIDAQYAPLSDRIKAALAELGDENPRLIINTHYHADHVGGNSEFGREGIILANENVRTRLINEGLERHALPLLTFADTVAIHFNGERIELIHLPEGHTDGDVVVIFTESNVVHMGDLFFRDRFPFVDLNAGGDVQGYIDNVEKIMELLDEETQVIPGHGSLAGREDLQRFVDMMRETADEVTSMRAEGMSRDEIVAAGLDEKWADWTWSFITEQRWIETLYDSYSR